MTLREFRAAVMAVAVEAGMQSASVSVTVQCWHHGTDDTDTVHYGASIHGTRGGVGMVAHVAALDHADAASPEAAIESLRLQLRAAGITASAVVACPILDAPLDDEVAS